ncbi:sugar ABC transporter permease [Lachnospiraceae bacterium 54-53]
MIKKKRNISYGLLFIAPFLTGLLMFRIIPFLYTLGMSFTNWNLMTGEKDFNGIENYKRLLTDKTFIISLKNTVKLWAMNIFPRFGIALLCAVIFTHSRAKGKGIFKMIFYFPNLVNSATVAILAALVMGWQNGYLNRLLIGMNLVDEPINWLGQQATAQGIVAFIIWWQWFGYSAIMFTTGILNVPNEYLEAATVDGANQWQKFRKITFPLIRPTVAYVFLTTLIGGLQNFEIPRVITNGLGAPDKALLTMTMQMHTLAFRSMQYGYGSAYAIGIFLITAVFAGVSYRFINKKES